jgi:hypothetical protein
MPMKQKFRPLAQALAQKEEKEVELAFTTYNMEKQIRYCADLLRQIYALDLKIWGMTDCHFAEVPVRDGFKREADELFVTVREIVDTWQTQDARSLNDEQAACVVDILDAIHKEGFARYGEVAVEA